MVPPVAGALRSDGSASRWSVVPVVSRVMVRTLQKEGNCAVVQRRADCAEVGNVDSSLIP